MYKTKIAVCSEIRTKHSMHNEHHVEFLNDWWYVKKALGFKRLILNLIQDKIVKGKFSYMAFRPIGLLF